MLVLMTYVGADIDVGVAVGDHFFCFLQLRPSFLSLSSRLLQWLTSTLSLHLQSHQDVEVGVYVDVQCHTSPNMHLQTHQVQFCPPTCCCKRRSHSRHLQFCCSHFLTVQAKVCIIIGCDCEIVPSMIWVNKACSISLHQWAIPKRSILKCN